MTRHDIGTWLSGHKGITVEHHPELPVDDIDLIASITNNARDIPIDDLTVERYVAALHAGAEFPPIIVRRLNDRLVVLGGNHRTKAHRDAGRPTIDAYIVECSDRTALEIAYGDNATHGLPPTESEQIAHALHLIDTYGHTVTKAARIVGVAANRIHVTRYAKSTERRAADLGVTEELLVVPPSVWPRLASIDVDKVFVAAVKAIGAERVNAMKAGKLIGDLNAQPGSKAALEFLDVYVAAHRAHRIDGRANGHPSENPYVVLRSTLGTILGLRPDLVAEAAGDAIARGELARLAHDAAGHLVDIHNAARMAGRVAS
jgi:uncharacterized ParB-like nuclease family protein